MKQFIQITKEGLGSRRTTKVLQLSLNTLLKIVRS